MSKISGNPAHNLPVIRASELASYSFCRRAWWLGVVKKIPSGRQKILTRGRQMHLRHERMVRRAVYWGQAGRFLVGMGGLSLLLGLLWLWLNSG